MDPKKLLGNVPWITIEGYFDPAKFPIDSVLKQALSDDDLARGGVPAWASENLSGMDVSGSPRLPSRRSGPGRHPLEGNHEAPPILDRLDHGDHRHRRH